jgi:DNA-binding transcriptional ArsR family regulator
MLGILVNINNFLVMRDKKNETVTLRRGGKEILLDYADLRKAVLVLRAVNHQLRQRIVDLLEESEGITVTDIYIKLRLEQSVASQHLAILRRAGVVKTERNGKFIYYSLDKNRLKQISGLVSDLTS